MEAAWNRARNPWEWGIRQLGALVYKTQTKTKPGAGLACHAMPSRDGGEPALGVRREEKASWPLPHAERPGSAVTAVAGAMPALKSVRRPKLVTATHLRRPGWVLVVVAQDGAARSPRYGGREQKIGDR